MPPDGYRIGIDPTASGKARVLNVVAGMLDEGSLRFILGSAVVELEGDSYQLMTCQRYQQEQRGNPDWRNTHMLVGKAG